MTTRGASLGRRWRFNTRLLPITVTVGLFLTMFGAGSIAFDNFFSVQVFLNFFIDSAFLGISAMGMTFVIIAGGIDLSVGSVIALTTMVSAALVEHHGWGPASTIPLVLALGAAIGLLQGFVIQYFNVQPFIATLAGQFLARGLCYVISIDSIGIRSESYKSIALYRVPLGGGNAITVNVIILLLMFAVGIYLAHYTRFGRTVYAIGGNEQSALLMGLPVASTKILVYVWSGFCSAVAGVCFTFYMLSGYGLHAKGLEMDAIACAVVGGTLLTGGLGYVAGTLMGMLVYSTILSFIIFQGSLNSWWTKIVVGLLLLVFCLLQKVFERKQGQRSVTAAASPAPRPATRPAAAG
ncbi:MAG TPA: galactofuranose ABC transporter, permease protein YjfF [Polyangiaceae bacterium]|jgi:simple sugar transport system permease protein